MGPNKPISKVHPRGARDALFYCQKAGIWTDGASKLSKIPGDPSGLAWQKTRIWTDGASKLAIKKSASVAPLV